LVTFAASQIEDHDVMVIKLTDYELPMFSEDLEKEQGFSSNLRLLHQEIVEADALIISVNEHNSGISAFFKNVTDWLSRLNRDFLKDKKVLLLATSPGGRGAMSALEFTKNTLPRFGAEVIDSFSFPKFYENFLAGENKITNPSLSLAFNDVLQNFIRQL
jgi:NAD(P)H-dependent FMN reductase